MKKLKKLFVNISLITIILAGAAILIYPALSNWLQSQYHQEVINTYDKDVNVLSVDFIEEEWEKALVYNQSLVGRPLKDPFVEGSGMAYSGNYINILNIDGIMGYLDIPSIDVHLPIYHGTSEEVLKKGVGHLENTALPIGGEGLNSILSAHTGIPSAKLFTDLVNLKIGDMFSIRVMNRVMHYKVNDIKVVFPEETKNLVAVSGKDYATLITCTPYGINTHRLIVRGERCFELSKSLILNQENRFLWQISLVVSSFLSLLFLIKIVIMFLMERKGELSAESC